MVVDSFICANIFSINPKIHPNLKKSCSRKTQKQSKLLGLYYLTYEGKKRKVVTTRKRKTKMTKLGKMVTLEKLSMMKQRTKK